MCHYKTWFYEEKKGYVIECKKCKKLQVGFGNVLLSFLQDDFNKFRQHIVQANGRRYPQIESGIKHVFIPTSCAGVTVLLNSIELEDLYSMLEQADNEMKAQELMGLF